MRVKFFGAAGTVTGSMHLLFLDNGKKILLDCGLYQGEEFAGHDRNSEFPCDPGEVDVLVLSHAHIDHCGNIPQFVKRGFRGKVFCTHATYDLCAVMLMDSAEIQEKDTEYDNKWRKKKGLPELSPLYTVKDVEPALKRFYTVPYEEWHSITEGVEVLFRDAGHMLGSASVTLRIQENGKEILFGFTGDVGRPDRPILRDPMPMPEVDYLISESTYGGKEHDPFLDAEHKLLEVIQEACVQKRGKLFIPAFSVGRTQDIVHALDKLEHEGKLPPIPIYVDSPLAIDATRVYELHPECFDDELREYMRHDKDPFGFQRLQYVRTAKESKTLNDRSGPMIIIAASGMANAGRILHHLANGIWKKENTVLIVGYCAEGTLGAKLVNGYRSVRIFGQEVEVNAKVVRLSAYSAHAGQSELYNFLSNQKGERLKQLWLVHGEPARSQAMKSFLEERGFRDVKLPERGENFVL